MDTKLEKEIDEITETKTENGIKYKLPRGQKIYKLGYKPLSKEELCERLGSHLIRGIWINKLAKENGIKKWNQVQVWGGLGYISFYGAKGEDVKSDEFNVQEVRISSVPRFKLLLTNYEDYCHGEIPTRVLEEIEVAKQKGFYNFKVAHQSIQWEELKDPIVVACRPPLTLLDWGKRAIGRSCDKTFFEITFWE